MMKKKGKRKKTKGKKRTTYKEIGNCKYPKRSGGHVLKTLYRKGKALYVKFGKKYVRVKKK
jgi:hypothetical protein